MRATPRSDPASVSACIAVRGFKARIALRAAAHTFLMVPEDGPAALAESPCVVVSRLAAPRRLVSLIYTDVAVWLVEQADFALRSAVKALVNAELVD